MQRLVSVRKYPPIFFHFYYNAHMLKHIAHLFRSLVHKLHNPQNPYYWLDKAGNLAGSSFLYIVNRFIAAALLKYAVELVSPGTYPAVWATLPAFIMLAVCIYGFKLCLKNLFPTS